MSESAVSTKRITHLNEMELLLIDPHRSADVLLAEARTVGGAIAVVGLGDLNTNPRVLLSDSFFVRIVVAASRFAAVVAVVVVLTVISVAAFALLSHPGYILGTLWFL